MIALTGWRFLIDIYTTLICRPAQSVNRIRQQRQTGLASSYSIYRFPLKSELLIEIGCTTLRGLMIRGNNLDYHFRPLDQPE